MTHVLPTGYVTGGHLIVESAGIMKLVRLSVRHGPAARLRGSASWIGVFATLALVTNLSASPANGALIRATGGSRGDAVSTKFLSCGSASKQLASSTPGTTGTFTVKLGGYAATTHVVIAAASQGVRFPAPTAVSVTANGHLVGDVQPIRYQSGGFGVLSEGSVTFAGPTVETCLAQFVGATEPTVVIPISGPHYSMGNYYELEYFPFDGGSMYGSLLQDLGISAAGILSTNDGAIVEARDTSFIGTMAPFAQAATPLNVFVPKLPSHSHWGAGTVVNVSRQYPKQVRADAQMLWSSAMNAGSTETALGPLAAWAADECELGAGNRALQQVDSFLRSHAQSYRYTYFKNRQDFDAALRRFLQAHGYL
jgi:hypothetical protein